jgi:hypothetical protein
MINEEEDVKAIIKRQNERKKNEDDTISRLETHYSKGSQSGLSDYTAVPTVNKYLWDKHKGGTTNSDLENKVHEMDITLSSKKTPEKLNVWSKSKHDPRELKDKDNIVHHPAFLSTSIRKSVPESIYNSRSVVKDKNGVNHHHIYNIEIPKNHPGAYIPDKVNVDNNAKEFVLPRKTNLKYHNTDTKNDSSNVYHYHKLSVI